MTVGIAFLFAFLIPILVTIASASSLHLGSMVTGGAPGGWRRTFREVALNRVVSDGGSLFVLLLLNALPLSLDTHIGLSLALLALLRIGLLIHLLARMVKGHQMNATRTCLLGLPGLCLSAIVAMALSVAPAFWFWAHCVVRTALG
jgi:hypothetical protein